ncbi:MAG: alpha-L-rhamnosidase [Chthoniobacter sp.]|nr:alpha-L-rhamnosidase [Chthoniobacter sp.]
MSVKRLFHALLFCLLTTVGLGESLRTTELRCEFAKDPAGIDVAHPRLFYRVTSEERGQRQTARQILVASSVENLAQEKCDLWDSGRVESDETAFLPYAGAALASSQQVFWKARVWDRDGKPSAWSETATWTMGMLGGMKEWKGAWIAAPGATETLLLRQEFAVKPGLRRAITHYCGLGQHELHLNGAKVGGDLLQPGWTTYDRTTLYETRDVTKQLREGQNAVGFVLGNGMYNVVSRNRFTKFNDSAGPLRAILHLQLEYADGTTEFVGTDETWRTQPGPITFSNVYGGEDYDARIEPIGWTKAGFDDHKWPLAVAMVRPKDTLRGHGVSADPIREIETRKPLDSKTFPDGSVVYDLGQNASFMPRIRVTGPAGGTIRLTPSEVVNPDGTINRRTTGSTERGGAWWQFTKATDAEETWFPKFFYTGCRYLKADFFPANGDAPAPSSWSPPPAGVDAPNVPRIESLEGVVVHSVAPPAGTFTTSNELLNRIRELVRWAQRSNMVSVLTDCPHRERLGWLEQYHLNGPSIRYEFNLDRMFTKGMNDMADAQTDEGLIPTTAPEYAKFKGTFRAAAEWGSAFLLVPWQQYEFTGDIELLRTHYDAMKRYFAYLASKATDEIVSEGLGDWYDLGPKKPGVAQLTPPAFTATAFYFCDAKLLARAAELLGKTDDAKDYAARAEKIRASFNRKFFNPDAGHYGSNSQCANAIPLVMGIVEPGDREGVLTALVHDVEEGGYAITAGDVGFRYLLQALAENGRSDVIYRMINQDEKPGYGFMLKKGATSLTEAWDANTSASHNHFMLGQITEWFYKDLAGIDCDPAGPGFKKIVLRQSPVGDLAWVEASYDSIRGPISMRWEHEGEQFVLKTTIPANTTATVFLPARNGAAVQESGKPAGQQPGVKFLRNDGDRAVFTIESGSYTFESKFAGP